ncbi:MAG: hemolysin III family protein [Stappiaceae bacterium]
MYPDYTRGERIADGCIHIVGVLASITAVVLLIGLTAYYLPPLSTTSLIIYGIASIAMFAFSAAYHLIPVPSWKDLLRRFDQAAIFIKIAGTYTPFILMKMSGIVGAGLLGVVWILAIFGATSKLFFPLRLKGLSVPLYLGLGWAGVLFIVPLFYALPGGALILLGVGGVLYSIGVIFHLWDNLPYQNAIWHAFVLMAASCHFAAIALISSTV